MKKYYVTTAIPYANANPHIGFALECVQADVLARYHRLLGEDVRFLSGTDENALKNVQAAEKAGLPTKDFVDQCSKNFLKLKEALNLSWDDFIRTTQERHIKGAQLFWQKTHPDDIYQKKYKGLYCVGCEAFYEKEDLNENGECIEHPGKKLEEVEEENYFFKLSKYQEFLEDLISTDKLKIIPEIRKNEMLAFLKQGLKDFSISRSKQRAKNWGIEVPNDSSQVMYVWYDALTNYVTALDFANNGQLYKDYWENNLEKIHIIGKGINRFHTIYWPAMLKSAELPLPKTVFVHGYVTSKGQKMSKSLGNVIDPFDQINKYGTDAVRYFLLREIPSFSDGDYTEERFKEVYNSDLANGLGNLVSRVAKLCEKVDDSFSTESYKDKVSRSDYLEEYKFDTKLIEIWQLIKWCDNQLENSKPWNLEGYDLFLVLDPIVHTICDIATDLKPFLPNTSEQILKQFTSEKITSKAPLFPRIK